MTTNPSINSRFVRMDDSEVEDEDATFNHLPTVATQCPGALDAGSGHHTEPVDKYRFNYMVFYLLGMTTLLPWNFFVTATDYWMYKFRNVTANASDHSLTPIQAELASDLNVASAVPNTMFLILNSFLGYLIPLQWRMLGSMATVWLFFVVTTCLVEVNTDEHQVMFFIVTMFTVVIMNIASAILSGGLFGLAGRFPSEYMTAIVSGQALGGIFATVTQLIALGLGVQSTTTALVYFIIGCIVMSVSIQSYLMVSRTIFFRYYTRDRISLVSASNPLMDERERLVDAVEDNEENAEKDDGDNVRVLVKALEPNFQLVFKKVWMYGFVEWFIFLVSLSIYPDVTVLVVSMDKASGSAWTNTYFTTVSNYLVFNCGDYLGRMLAGYFEWPTNRPKLLMGCAVLRAAFIPLFMLCNAQPRLYLPVLINSDTVYMLLMSLFALSNGYLANIGLISAPKNVLAHEREMAASMMAAFLGVGLAFGSAVGIVLVKIL